MSDHDFKLASEMANAAISHVDKAARAEISRLREALGKMELKRNAEIKKNERLRAEAARWQDTSEGWRQGLVREKDEHKETRKTIDYLRSDLAYKETELEDVRGQRSVLVMEGEALGRAVQQLRAEVERRGEMLKWARHYLQAFIVNWVGDISTELNHGTRRLISEIESLDNAPATSTVNAESVPRDQDG